MKSFIIGKWKISVFLFAIVFIFSSVSFAENEYFDPITELSLGIDELVMQTGEIYTFPLSWLPRETPAVFISWLTDDTILDVDPEHFTITAKAAGTTRLLVESNAGFAMDWCDITVTGPEGKDAGVKLSGSELVQLSPEDRAKIKAETVLNYQSFLENSSFSGRQFAEVSGRMFNLTAIVSPGMAEPESKLAASLGMSKALPLRDLDAVSLRGSITQILAFIENNADLIRLIEFAPMKLTDPAADPYTEGSIEKSISLGSHVETLTRVSTAHNAGYTGRGTAVAIVDTGLNANHEQFSGRVIAEACLAAEGSGYTKSCTEGSSEPSQSQSKALHNHGSHVTGIAAGKNGIAPDADIVSINISAENCSGTQCVQTLYWSTYEVAQYLKNLQDRYREAGSSLITAVNMSLGSGRYSSSVCDADEPDYKSALDLLAENDMIPVVSAGNESKDGSVSVPACISNAFTVGALTASSTPTIADFSNHSPQVSILAPGTEIYSAAYVYQNDNLISSGTCADGVGGTSNCYGISQGTSQAAPMVTGAFAILKQAFPEMGAEELEAKLLSLASGTANKRANGTTFDFSKPVLNFYGISEHEPNTCGVNVSYAISGNTISFTRKNTDVNAWWSSDCGYVFKDNSAVTKVVIADTIHVAEANQLFRSFEYVEEMDLEKFDVSEVTDFTGMFADCKKLQRLKVSSWKTEKAADMSGMFDSCWALAELDVSKWNTAAVTSFLGMFAGCNSMTEMDLSRWDTSNVTDMNGIFNGCISLTSLDVHSWDTSKVTDMGWMFANCEDLMSLDVKNWDTSNVTDMNTMFENCTSLTALDVSKWDTSKVTDMNTMFWGCSSLKSLDLSGWNTSAVTNMTHMFINCYALESLDVSGWNTTNAKFNIFHWADSDPNTDPDELFDGCFSLSTIKLGRNTLGNRNFFGTLPNYSNTWYYIAAGADAGSPIALGTGKDSGTLFTGYNYNTMAGIWSTDPDYAAGSNVLTLPSGTKQILASAFEGASSMEEAILPNGLTTIGSRAFAFCGLRSVHIPDSVTSIAEDAFVGNANMIIFVKSNNSSAAAYAGSKGIPYRVE